MSRIENAGWYAVGRAEAIWDATEIEVETAGGTLTVCPFVGLVPGPDNRWVASLDVPDSQQGIRALVPPVFASSRKEAKSAVADMIKRIGEGLLLVA